MTLQEYVALSLQDQNLSDEEEIYAKSRGMEEEKTLNHKLKRKLKKL